VDSLWWATDITTPWLFITFIYPLTPTQWYLITAHIYTCPLPLQTPSHTQTLFGVLHYLIYHYPLLDPLFIGLLLLLEVRTCYGRVIDSVDSLLHYIALHLFPLPTHTDTTFIWFVDYIVWQPTWLRTHLWLRLLRTGPIYTGRDGIRYTHTLLDHVPTVDLTCYLLHVAHLHTCRTLHTPLPCWPDHTTRYHIASPPPHRIYHFLHAGIHYRLFYIVVAIYAGPTLRYTLHTRFCLHLPNGYTHIYTVTGHYLPVGLPHLHLYTHCWVICCYGLHYDCPLTFWRIPVFPLGPLHCRYLFIDPQTYSYDPSYWDHYPRHRTHRTPFIQPTLPIDPFTVGTGYDSSVLVPPTS